MRRFNLLRAVVGGLVILVLLGLVLAEIKRRARTWKPSGRVPIAFRILADPQHDPKALEEIEAGGKDALPKAPEGFRWAKVGEKSEIRPDRWNIIREDPATGEAFVLVRLDPQNVTEKHVAGLYPATDEIGRAAIGFSMNEQGARRFGVLTRTHLPEEGGAFKYRMAIILGDTAVSAPSMNSEIRDAGIIEGGQKGYTAREVDDLILLLTQLVVIGVEPSGPADAHVEARRWFQDARFGLSVHWGVDSLLGKGDSVMEKDKLPISEYEKLPPQFNPAGFNAEEWVKTARAAGMKYFTVTAKHHDGFCMFDSKLTRFDVVDATPFAKDPLKPLAEACRKHGLKLFFSYSLLDWHHPDYVPRGKTGRAAGRDESGDWSKYVAYYQGQVRELCTNYGAIGGLRFEGGWDRPDADWDLAGTYVLIHDLQPAALIGNTHHETPRPGEDFQIFERDPPGKVASGSSKAASNGSLPMETCLTLNRSWGYNARDKDYKSPEQVVHLLLGASGRGANLLLSVGPKPDGTFGPEVTERLQAVGLWLDKFGDSVYGTRRGPIAPQPWGVSTTREKPATIYLHVLKPEQPISLPKALLGHDARPFRSTVLLKKDQDKDGFTIEVPEKLRTPIDTVIVLTPGVMDR